MLHWDANKADYVYNVNYALESSLSWLLMDVMVI